MQPSKALPIISSHTASPHVGFTHRYGSVLVSVAAWLVRTPAGSTVEATLSNFLVSFDFPLFLSGLFSPVLQSFGQVSLRRVWSVWRYSRRGEKRQLYTNWVNMVVYDIRDVRGEDCQSAVIYDVWTQDKGERKSSTVSAHCHNASKQVRTH